MTRYSHQPADYDCPFCRIATGRDVGDGWSVADDVFYRTEHVTAFIAAAWWPNNAGHALIIPNVHIENIYEMPADTHMHIMEAARQIAIAFKSAYGCDGISTRQHNEPAGYQEVWHYHLHVFPRYEDDYLYDLSYHRRRTTPAERQHYADKLRRYFDGNNQ